jgi:glycosyltransferase involved in cell wall biosynthesis
MDRRLRVVCVIADMEAGGAQRVLAQLCNDFARDHDVALVTFAPAAAPPFYRLSDSVRLVQLGRPRSGLSFHRTIRVGDLLLKFRPAMKSLKPDVVISFIDLTNIFVLLAAAGLGAPIIVSERIDPAQYAHRLPVLARRLRRPAYSRAARIVVQTARAAAFFRDWPASKLVIIPNPVRPAAAVARPDIPSADGRFRIVAVGRLDHQKGYDLLIESFARLAARFPQWDVAIFGEGAERKALETRIRTLGLSDRVRLMGIIQDIENELARSHVMALSSRYEGFPNALTEAMAAGLPAVAFESVSGVEDLIVPNTNGLIASWRDTQSAAIQAFGEALSQLMASASLRIQLGAAARRRVEAIEPAAVLGQWKDLIAAVVQEYDHRLT